MVGLRPLQPLEVALALRQRVSLVRESGFRRRFGRGGGLLLLALLPLPLLPENPGECGLLLGMLPPPLLRLELLESQVVDELPQVLLEAPAALLHILQVLEGIAAVLLPLQHHDGLVACGWVPSFEYRKWQKTEDTSQ